MKLLLIVLVTCTIFNVVPSIAAEWVSIEGSSEQFDKTSIKIDKTTGIIKVWKKYVLSGDVVKKLEKDLLRDENPIDYSNYSYSIELNGVNCKDETLVTISGTTYNNNGSAIFSYKAEEQKLQFSPVTPESVGELFLQTVCNFVAKDKQKKKYK